MILSTTPVGLKRLVKETARIREESWVTSRVVGVPGHYARSTSAAAEMACIVLDISSAYAEPVAMMLSGDTWNQALAWAERVD